jgi:hypothetical protein
MTSVEERAPLDDIDLAGTDAPLNPVEVEAGIRKIARMIHYGIKIVSDAERDWRQKSAAHDRVFARAYCDHDGPAHEKKYAAEIHPDVVQARDQRDVAEWTYRHAERRQKALIEQLGALRSIGASVREMYRSETGTGR